jgi:DNA helicase-2/ATP-dependent DNA helicase PcrA
MTVHSAKGLEFRVVFIVGMEEELFPSSMSSDSPRQLEEERRLFYVAITRAEEYLVITNAKSRFRYGKTEMCKPSRFLREIDPLYIRISGISSGNAILTSAINNVRPSASIITTPPSARPSVSSTSATPTGADARRFVRVTPSLHSSPQLAASHPAANTSNLSVGTKILHERFGHGTITAIEGTGIDTKATVLFENVGIKQLLLRFAKFKVI